MSFLKTADRYFHTLGYLKPEQVLYRAAYMFSPVRRLKKVRTDRVPAEKLVLPVRPLSDRVLSVDGERYTFRFLNLEKTYHGNVVWNDSGYGRLWNYHLQYADFLHQTDLPAGLREALLTDLYDWLTEGRLQPEPYPASLRIMNILRYLNTGTSVPSSSADFLDHVYSELHFIRGRMEYHLSGNHLLENAFALMMGGVYFHHSGWRNFASALLDKELKEQILEDGAHMERSPMYHQIMLFRVLEALCYLSPSESIFDVLVDTARRMLSWLQKMTFRNGTAAAVNDSVPGVSPSTPELVEMASRLNLPPVTPLPLSESGFRLFETPRMELLADIGGIKPDHQPGHAHADSLSFILHVCGKPVIVDPGVSTYEPGQRRQAERSTRLHNTVTVDNQNSADVWGVFRVGRRPDVSVLEESEHSVTALLRYRPLAGQRVTHQRSFSRDETRLMVTDQINQRAACGRLHLHPDISAEKLDDRQIRLSGDIRITFDNIDHLSFFEYEYNHGFNRRTPSRGILYRFSNYCMAGITTEL